MKIRDINKASNEVQRNVIGNDKQSVSDTSKMFHKQLSNLSHENHQKYINNLVEKINAQGELITEKADIKEIQKYRSLISELINDTVSNSFEYVKSEHFSMRGRHRVFNIIKNINKKLDDMTSEVLQEQQDNIRIANAVDDIRGMLVDLFL